MDKIVSDNRARQGPRGRPVLMVLVGSLVLLGVYMIGLMVWSGSESPPSPSQDASRAATTGTPQGKAGGNPSDRTPSANPAYPAQASPTATQPASR